MNGGKKEEAQKRLVLLSAAIIFAYLIICPLPAVVITYTANSEQSPENTCYSDIYRKNDLKYPFWPLENNIHDGLSEEDIKTIGGYLYDHRVVGQTAGRINFGACKAVFIDCRDYVHEIVFYKGNTTAYNLVPELMAEEVTALPGGDEPSAGYRIYRIYPEFPAYYNAETPYIDFIDVWTDSSVSYIGGDLVNAKTAGRFYRNTDGTIAKILDMTEATKTSTFIFSNEKRASSGVTGYFGTVSFDGEYSMGSIPVKPEMFIDSYVTYGPGDNAETSSFTGVSLSNSFGMLGLLLYLILLGVSGDRILKYYREKKEERENIEK